MTVVLKNQTWIDKSNPNNKVVIERCSSLDEVLIRYPDNYEMWVQRELLYKNYELYKQPTFLDRIQSYFQGPLCD